MTIDGPTLLLMSLGIAAITAIFLVLEWRALRDPALPYWAGGFGAVTIGCSMSTLREADQFMLGIWAADAFLIVAHLFFLFGLGRFIGRRLSPAWAALMLSWLGLAMAPLSSVSVAWLGILNAALVAIAALRTGILGITCRRDGVGRLGALFAAHGAFYCFKTVLAFEPGAFAGITRFGGIVIQASLFEGILVEVTLVLLMVEAVRRRRERTIAALAERDPLTRAYNRRAFDFRAREMLAEIPPGRRLGALMLLDIDHFKPVNDTFGHAIGDDTLIALTDILDAILPRNALIARYGGDEFVVLLPDAAPALVTALGDAICGEFARLNRYFRDVPITATVSIGAAMLADAGTDLPCLMAAADAAAYEAKRRGGDQICLHGIVELQQAFAVSPAA